MNLFERVMLLRRYSHKSAQKLALAIIFTCTLRFQLIPTYLCFSKHLRMTLLRIIMGRRSCRSNLDKHQLSIIYDPVQT